MCSDYKNGTTTEGEKVQSYLEDGTSAYTTRN